MIPLISFSEQTQPVLTLPPLQKEPVKSAPAKHNDTKKPASQGGLQNQPTQTKAEQKSPPRNPESPFNPALQKKYILDDPMRFMGILFDTIKKFMGLYVIAFIGLFGWVDSPLPPPLIYSFFFLLILISLTEAVTEIKISFLKKCILLAIFLISVFFVEAAMYLYCNPVGFKLIQAVQGRYFIALSPFLFILFYNRTVSRFLNNAMIPPSERVVKEKHSKKKKPMTQTTVSGELYSKSLPWLIIGFGLFALLYSLYHILFRFYIVLI